MMDDSLSESQPENEASSGKSMLAPMTVSGGTRWLPWLTLVGVVLFLISPWLPALDLGEDGTYPGWPLLFFGWIGVFRVLDGDVNAIGWIANPLFAIGTIAFMVSARKAALVVLVCAAIFALAGFWLSEVLLNEGGTTARVMSHTTGFWVWIGSIWFNCLIALIVCCAPTPHSKRSA